MFESKLLSIWLQLGLVTDALQSLLEDLEHEFHFLQRRVLAHEPDPKDLVRRRTEATGYLHSVSERDFSIEMLAATEK